MSDNEKIGKLVVAACAICVGVVALMGAVGCEKPPPGSADLTWIEPVQLAAGETVNVKRHVVMWHERALGGGFSSAPVYKTSTIELLPSAPQFPVWDAPLVPLVIDRDPANGEWVIVASIDGCSFWLRNGLPRPPYWAFRLRHGEWYRDAIPEFMLSRAANLYVEFDVTDTSGELDREIEARKRSQTASPKHAPQYRNVDPAFGEFERCGRDRPSRAIGENELDLNKYRKLP